VVRPSGCSGRRVSNNQVSVAIKNIFSQQNNFASETASEVGNNRGYFKLSQPKQLLPQ